MKKIIQLGLIAASAGFIVLLYGHFIERTHLETITVGISSDKLPPQFKAKLVQLSDLHLSSIGGYEEKVIRTVNALEPDAILITGDFVHHREVFEHPDSGELKKCVDAVSQFLQSLKAPKGIFVCRGNNDFGNDKEVSDVLLDAMTKVGVKVLSNQSAPIRFQDQNLYVLGVDYPEFHRREVADFYVAKYDQGQCMQMDASERNSYSHLLIGDARGRWSNYTFSGKIRQSDPERGGIGLTFYSQFDVGYDRFYRLRRVGGDETFVLSPHGAPAPVGDRYVATKIKADEWYQFRIRCQSFDSFTRMQARVWPASEPEPSNWQADAIDSTAAFSGGTVGLWGHGPGRHQFDDLLVVDADGDTLRYEDFEDVELLGDPFGWVDFNYERESIPWLMAHREASEFTILLSHTPDNIKWAAAAGVDIQLSGHTHGGQIQLPLYGPILVRSALGRKFAEGLYDFDRTSLYVNRGIGTVLLPLRLFCRPEITVFELRGTTDN